MVTHSKRPPLGFVNGTRFEFLAVSPEVALTSDRDYTVTSEVAESGVIHVTFER